MTDKLKQITERELGKLPKEFQEAINSLPWGNITEEIGRKNLLSDSEINDLQTETLLVLVGLEAGEDFARNIENNAGTSKCEAEKITREVDERVFKPVYDFLANIMKKKVSEEKPEMGQNIDFILSGGNYLAFMPKQEEKPDQVRPVGTSSTNDMKDRLIN